jgi:hypothetical protein
MFGSTSKAAARTSIGMVIDRRTSGALIVYPAPIPSVDAKRIGELAIRLRIRPLHRQGQ